MIRTSKVAGNELWIEFRLAFERVHATGRVYACIAQVASDEVTQRVRSLLREFEADLGEARTKLQRTWRDPD